MISNCTLSILCAKLQPFSYLTPAASFFGGMHQPPPSIITFFSLSCSKVIIGSAKEITRFYHFEFPAKQSMTYVELGFTPAYSSLVQSFWLQKIFFFPLGH